MSDRDDGDWDDEFEDDEDEAPRRRRRPPSRPAPRSRRPAPRRREKKPGFFARLFGSAPPPRRERGRLSFDDLGEDEEPREPRRGRGDRDRDRDRDRERPPARRGRPRHEGDGKQKTLLEICRPVFQYVGVLPVEEGQQGPDFLKFREGVVEALQRIEPDARQHGLEIQDAQEALYALALLIDEQVLESTWHAREQWAEQPLAIHLLNDPEGGVNFYRRLERLRDDQTDVMQIYLFCLALGYRGMYVTEELRKREATIEKIKQDLWRRIGTPGTESAERLFPEAYTTSQGVEDEVEPPPRWWVWTSVGVVAACLLLWIVLFVWAGASAEATKRSLQGEEISWSLDGRGARAC